MVAARPSLNVVSPTAKLPDAIATDKTPNPTESGGTAAVKGARVADRLETALRTSASLTSSFAFLYASLILTRSLIASDAAIITFPWIITFGDVSTTTKAVFTAEIPMFIKLSVIEDVSKSLTSPSKSPFELAITVAPAVPLESNVETCPITLILSALDISHP